MRVSITRDSIAAGILAAAVLAVGGCKPAADATGTTRDTEAFVACMRTHDLPDFPDVTVSSDGLINFNINGESVDVHSEKYGAAVKACEHLLPDGLNLPAEPAAPAAPTLR